MERLCYAAGLKPEEMYDCTIDELIGVYKGKVQDWRIQRACANLIHRSLVETPVNILEEIPLPFDDELIAEGERAKQEEAEQLIKEYNEVKEKWGLDK